jgi:hypothetical protein
MLYVGTIASEGTAMTTLGLVSVCIGGYDGTVCTVTSNSWNLSFLIFSIYNENLRINDSAILLNYFYSVHLK